LKRFRAMRLKSKAKAFYALAFVFLTLTAVSGLVSAQRTIQATIIAPGPYRVYTSQTYSLPVGVQYNAPLPPPTAPIPSYYLWIESPPYASDRMAVSGLGTTEFYLTLTAPSTPGTYQLTLNLYGQVQGGSPSLLDTATVIYEVVTPIVTDWDVEKVWLEPSAPGEGDKIAFHATIVLLSTNAEQSLTVAVACSLDKKIVYTGSLTFSPQPSRQEITIPNMTAVNGTHTFACAVDPDHAHNDPTPYPYYDVKSVKFTVEPYYAIIQSITTSPPEGVMEGEEFTVVITVAYKFPSGAILKIHHWSNGTMPLTDEQRIDDVKLTGSGTKDYTFRARAAFTPSMPTPWGCGKWMLPGYGSVMFDRGAGWQKTDSGWDGWYNVTVKRPEYYAVFDSVTAEYNGPAENGTSATGRFTITLSVRYLLPIESGLRIVITEGSNTTEPSLASPYGTEPMKKVLEDVSNLTQEESAEKTATYTYDYSFPLSAVRSSQMPFTAYLEYQACGAWNFGDQQSASASVPYTPPTPPDNSIAGYIIDAFQRIVDWFKALFGYRQEIAYERYSRIMKIASTTGRE